MTCATCTLNNCVKVPGHGSDRARLVLVGEAPGDEEARRGQPFVGPAGRLLDEVLEECGIVRFDLYITNAVLCRPDPHRKPTVKEVRLCRARLIDEVLSRAPTVVVTLGDVATKALLGTTGPLRDSRGVPVQVADLHGAWVVPTYHPAAVLRQPGLWFDVVRDMGKALQLLEQPAAPVLRLEELTFPVVADGPRFAELLTMLKGASAEVVIDVETDSRGEVLCLALAWSPTDAAVVTDAVLQKARYAERLDTVLGDKILIGHNLKFDLQALWRAGWWRISTGWDTMLAHYCLDERRGTHKLKPLAREHLGVSDYEAAVSPYMRQGLQHCPRDLLYRYNASDAVCTYALAVLFNRQLSADGHRVLDNLLLPASDIVGRMEQVGIRVDLDVLYRLAEELSVKLEAVTAQIYAVVGHEFNINSPKQLRRLLYHDLQLPIPGGKGTTAEDALELLESFHPLPRLVLEYRGIKKLLSTYVQALLDAADSAGRVHTTFNLHGTVTGRLSSSNPVNLQNIPKKKDVHGLRKVFVATPGWTLVRGDLSQAEVRVLAYYSRDERLLAALRSGHDVHRQIAADIKKCRPEEVTLEQRDRAKQATFGVIYGIGSESLGRRMGIPTKEAEELIQEFFDAHPDVRRWIREIQKAALATGEVRTPLGRVRRFGFVTYKNRGEVMRQAVNTPIQSLASDITLLGLIHFGYAIQGNPNTRLLLTVHDELLVETREHPYAIAAQLHDAMLAAAQALVDVPFEVEVSIGQNWGEMEVVRFDRQLQSA